MNEWNVRQHKSVQQPPQKKGDTFFPQPQFQTTHRPVGLKSCFGLILPTKQWTFSRWWFQISFIFIPTWGRFPFWLIFFNWIETTNQFWSVCFDPHGFFSPFHNRGNGTFFSGCWSFPKTPEQWARAMGSHYLLYLWDYITQLYWYEKLQGSLPIRIQWNVSQGFCCRCSPGLVLGLREFSQTLLFHLGMMNLPQKRENSLLNPKC